VTREIVCIICPNGCRIRISGRLKIMGHKCHKGFEYAVKESTNPERVITSSVKVINGELPLASVKTNSPIPKVEIKKIMEIIKKARIKAPLNTGDVIVKNICGSGVDLVATRKVRRK